MKERFVKTIFFGFLLVIIFVTIYLFVYISTYHENVLTNGSAHLTSDDFNDSIVPLMGDWMETYTADGKKYTATLALDNSGLDYNIVVENLYDDYKLQINNSVIYESGSFISKDILYAKTICKAFPTTNNVLVIAITTKNDSITNDVVQKAVLLSQKGILENKHNLSIIIETIISTICLFSGLFFFVQYHYSKHIKIYLYLSLLCLTSFFKLISISERLILYIIPNLPNKAGLLLSIISEIFTVILIIVYSRATYPEDFKSRLIKPFVIFMSVITALLLFLPSDVIASMFPIIRIFLFSALAYTLLTGLLIYYRKRTRRITYVIGLYIFILTYLFDVSYYIYQTYKNGRLYFGISIFIYVNAQIIAKRYKEVYRRQEILSAKLKKTVRKMHNTENAFLCAQMKPHFLYNTLNTIADCCITNPTQAQKLIKSLTQYLQRTLSYDHISGEISLTRELELVYAYTSIENVRFPDIKIIYEIPENIPPISIPPLTIQPLVENAIKHGVRKLDKPGTVTINITVEAEEIVISVSDTGLGMSDNKITKLLEKPTGNRSIGLYNINTRLKRLYNRELIILAVPNIGTTITFSIPFHTIDLQ